MRRNKTILWWVASNPVQPVHDIQLSFSIILKIAGGLKVTCTAALNSKLQQTWIKPLNWSTVSKERNWRDASSDGAMTRSQIRHLSVTFIKRQVCFSLNMLHYWVARLDKQESGSPGECNSPRKVFPDQDVLSWSWSVYNVGRPADYFVLMTHKKGIIMMCWCHPFGLSSDDF